MQLRNSLPRAWVTIGVPGTAHPWGTYAAYAADRLPLLPAALSEGDGLGWLRALRRVDPGMGPDEWSHVTTPVSRAGIEDLLRAAGSPTAFDDLPADVRALADDQGLHARLFSATDAYFDAGDRLEPVPGGHLLHLVSDSQWVVHWLAFLGDDGSTGVVCSEAPLGYADDEGADGASTPGTSEMVWAADSVAEFVWRWWADNYAFASAHPDVSPQLPAPDWFDLGAYVAGYGAPQPAPSQP